MKLILSLILATLIAFPANAATAPRQAFASYGTVINAVALDTASESFAINMSNAPANGVWGLMLVWVDVVDADDSTTAVNMACTGSPNGGAKDFVPQECASVVDGLCTSENPSWRKNPSAMTSPKSWFWRVDIEGIPEIECTFTDTGGAAADTITVTVTFATKG
jgi:hypothetical protein